MMKIILVEVITVIIPMVIMTKRIKIMLKLARLLLLLCIKFDVYFLL